MQELINKIENGTAKMCVIGLGYVGLPLAIQMAKAGFEVLGVDIDKEKIRRIEKGESYIHDVSNDELEGLVKNKCIKVNSNFASISYYDCICICVPTPLDEHKQPDLSFLKSAVKSISQYMHNEMIIILESTSYPGTTEELVMPALEESGLKCGKDFYLAFSPERVDPGNKTYNINNTPKIVGGVTKECTIIATALYQKVLDASICSVSRPVVAEMAKMLENSYRNINIGLINEFTMVCNKLGINVWEVIEVAKSKPYGFQAFYPGIGVGGHCIPIDPYYLTWKVNEYNYHISMIETSMKINESMTEYCKFRIIDVLSKHNICINGASVLMLGVAYKENINDYRESPAVRLMTRLIDFKMYVRYYDPYIQKIQGAISMESELVLTPEIIGSYDLVVIAAAHTIVNYVMVKKYAKLIFDTKNVFKDVECRDNIESL